MHDIEITLYPYFGRETRREPLLKGGRERRRGDDLEVRGSSIT